MKNVKQENLPPKKRQRAAILPELLREFLNNDAIMFSRAAIHHDVQMLEY
jgi:hypothetical protein